MDKNKKPTIQELEQELARERAKNAHLKNLLDRALSEKAHFKRVLTDHEEDERKREQKDEAREKEIDKLRRELETINYQKEFVEMGMRKEKAEETARAMLEKDEDTFYENIEMLIKETKVNAQNEAVQKFLKSRPEVNAGNGSAEIEPSAIKFAKQYVGRQTIDADVLERFK